MLGAYFSPLAPAVLLLLSAFVLSIVLPRLPAERLSHRGAHYFIAPGLVGLVLLALFGVRLSDTESGLGQLTSWRFSASEAVTALGVRADGLSLSFLILTALILLIMTLTTLPLSLTVDALDNSTVSTKELEQWKRLSGWLVLGAGASLAYVAANALTLSYTLLIFEALLAYYWLKRGHIGLSVARLFLGILTASALSIAAVSSAGPTSPGAFLVGLSLWLRLGLYPFIEMTAPRRQPDDERLAYLVLSLAVGIYLAAITLSQPLPAIVSGLTTMLLLLNGLLVWLENDRSTGLIHLTLATSLLILLAAPLEATLTAAFSLGLILGFAALWLTPRLGPPKFNPNGWFWPYLPALAATLTLIGLPYTLGWPSSLAIYDTLLRSQNLIFFLLAILAEAFALSGLVRYWLLMWQQDNEGDAQSAAIGFVAMIPFLVPGLAPLVLSLIMATELPAVEVGQAAAALAVLVIVASAAIVLGYFREGLLARIEVSPAILSDLIGLRWLFPNVSTWLDRAGKIILRTNIIIEGQHYVGWAIFAAIVGTLIILLRA